MAEFKDYLRKFIKGSDLQREAMIQRAIYHATRMGMAAESVDAYNIKQIENISEQTKTNIATLHTIVSLYKGAVENTFDKTKIFGSEKFEDAKFTFKGSKLNVKGENKVDWTDIKVTESYDKAKYRKINKQGEQVYAEAAEGYTEAKDEVEFVNQLEDIKNELEEFVTMWVDQLVDKYTSEQPTGEIIFKQDSDPANMFDEFYYKLEKLNPGTDKQVDFLDRILDKFTNMVEDFSTNVSYGTTNKEYLYFENASSFSYFVNQAEAVGYKIADYIESSVNRLRKAESYRKSEQVYYDDPNLAKDTSRTKQDDDATAILKEAAQKLREKGYTEEEVSYTVRKMFGGF